jgi:hypothetical protein
LRGELVNDLSNPIGDDQVEAAAREEQDLAADAAVALSPKARRMIRDALMEWRGETRSVMTRKQYRLWAGGISENKQLEIERAGELDTLHDGAIVLVTVKSAYLRRIKQIIASNPVHGPAPKARDNTPPSRAGKRADKARGFGA